MRNLEGFTTAAKPVNQLEQHGVQFIEIDRTTPEPILVQLTGKDRVHSFGTQSVDELLEYRLGGSDFDKTCFAIADENRNPHAVIYIKKDTTPIARERDLNGNVRMILSEKVSPLGTAPTSLIFYSISNISDKPGMGQLLVKQLHAHLTRKFEQATLSTLSPLRSFDDYLKDANIREFDTYTDHEKRKTGLDYLLTVKDSVQKFHMGNGAYIGDIKLGADNQGEARMMVNYVYSACTETLARNTHAFKQRDLSGLVSPALMQEAGYRTTGQHPVPEPVCP